MVIALRVLLCAIGVVLWVVTSVLHAYEIVAAQHGESMRTVQQRAEGTRNPHMCTTALR